MRCRCCLLLLFLLIGANCVSAQNTDGTEWRELLELWAEQNDNDAIPDDLAEQVQELTDSPVNLNDTNLDLAAILPFITDFQARAIKSYIVQNGEMVSMNELHFVNGIDTTTLRLLRCFAKVAPVPENDVALKQLMKRGHSNVVLGAKTVRPESNGYQNDAYLGSPTRYYFRYRYKSSDRISFQFSGEKDAGEMFAFGNSDGMKQYGFDYYSYHLMLSKFGRIKNFVIGKYQLQFGQGLTMWSGSALWLSGSMPLRRYGVGIRPASAFCEYGYLRGMATTISLIPSTFNKELDLTVYYSNVDRDATLSATDTAVDVESYIQSLNQTGLHRTASERRRKGQLNEQLYGGRLQFRSGSMTIGATAFATHFSNDILPTQSVYNYFAFRGKDNFNCGLDAVYTGRRIQLFGEFAASAARVNATEGSRDWLPMAAVLGMQMSLGGSNSFSMAYRYASPTYHSFHSSMIGQGSSVSNEEGVLLYFKMRLPLYINLLSSVDFFRFPTPRYNIYSPSSGIDYRLALDKELANNAVLTCQYRYKTSQRNSDGRLYSVETIKRKQLRMSLEYNPSQRWRLLSRVVFSWFDSESGPGEQGFLLSQEASWNKTLKNRPFSLGMRLSLFDISDFDARIYAYESDLMYEYGIPMLIGRGMRNYLICRYELATDVTLSLKYAVAYYPELELLGTGNDRIEGNLKQEFKIQLRWHF